MPRYLYGLVPSATDAPPERGVGGGVVRVEPLADGLGVLTSDLDEPSVQPRRAHLTAHDRVLRAAMATGAVLPLGFGVVTDRPTTVLDGVDAAPWLERMTALEGRVEVQVLWDPDGEVALRRVAERHPEVRDRRLDEVDRGRMVSERMSELAVEDLAAIRAELSQLVVTTADVEPRGSSARVAVLVESQAVDGFLDRCEVLARRAGTVGTLRTVGPLPPYSFAEPDRSPIGA